MLTLIDPVDVDGTSLFRDDVDPARFYVLPDTPVIPVDDKGVPDFLFIMWLDAVQAGDAGESAKGGGYVHFRTVLTMAAEKRTAIVARLQKLLQDEQKAGVKPSGNAIVSTEPILADPVWTKGEAKLSTFKAGQNELVRSVTDSVPVDLAGALGASGNVQLSPEGAEIFWTAATSFTDRQLPILVTYNLSYKARVPASIEIHADRSTVVKQIWQNTEPRPMFWDRRLMLLRRVRFDGVLVPETLQALRQQNNDDSIDAFVPLKDIKGAVKTAVTKGSIDARISIDGAGGADSDKLTQLLFGIASDLLSSKLIPALFGSEGPTGQPTDDKPAASDDTQLVRLPGWGTGQGSDTRFDISITSATTFERSCNPSAPLHVILKDPEVLKACFHQLRLGDSFFAKKRISIATVGVNLARDGIDAVHVYCLYDEIDEPHPDKPQIRRSFDGNLLKDGDTLHWEIDLARDGSGAHKGRYRYRADVYYRDFRILSTERDWRYCDSDSLDIGPAAMGAVRVELQLVSPPPQIKSARVTMRYQPPGGEAVEDSQELLPDKPWTWFRPTGELTDPDVPFPPAPSYTYQWTWRLDGSQIAMPPVRSTSERIALSTPFERVLSFVLVPQGSFEGVRALTGAATYTDARYGYEVRQSWALMGLGDSKEIKVPILPGGPETIHLTTFVERTDGTSTSLGDQIASPGQVRAGRSIESYLEIEVHTDVLDFDKDVQIVVAQIGYHDPSTTPDPPLVTMTFSKAQRAPQVCRFPVRVGAPLDYAVDARYIAFDRNKSHQVHLLKKNGALKDVFLLGIDDASTVTPG